MAEFELLRVHDPVQLHENLVRLLNNKKYIEAVYIDESAEEIRVDLSKLANTFGNPDFRLKLKPGKVGEARTLMDHLKNQDHPLRTQSEELFAIIQH